MALSVQDIMTRDVVTVDASSTLSELEHVLTRERVSGVPVLEAGRVAGIVSRTDIIRRLCIERVSSEMMLDYFVDLSGFHESADDTDLLGRVLAGSAARLESLKVADIMVTEVVGIRPDAPLSEAARLMLEHHFHRLPVIRDGILLGIVSSFDFLRLAAETDQGTPAGDTAEKGGS